MQNIAVSTRVPTTWYDLAAKRMGLLRRTSVGQNGNRDKDRC